MIGGVGMLVNSLNSCRIIDMGYGGDIGTDCIQFFNAEQGIFFFGEFPPSAGNHVAHHAKDAQPQGEIPGIVSPLRPFCAQ